MQPTWAVTAGYCVCILAGQAVIALTEIGFAWLLDVTVLRDECPRSLRNLHSLCWLRARCDGCRTTLLAGSASEIDGGGADGGGGPPPHDLARVSRLGRRGEHLRRGRLGRGGDTSSARDRQGR